MDQFFRRLIFILIIAVGATALLAETPAVAGGTVAGALAIPDSSRPLEPIAVTLQRVDGTVVGNTSTDAQGRFKFERIPPGDYLVGYHRVGSEGRVTTPFKLEAAPASIDLGTLDGGETPLQLDKISVTARQQTQLNSIDRKVYNVGREIQSTTGSASDLLQNVPSVDVDIDGNVSLRGSDNVLILIDGRSSALMGRSRAEVLQQLPADEIEKIEVITNPSAKYQADGTAGIINIALKKKHSGGASGTLNTSVGNGRRYSTGLSVNYHPGAYNLFGSFSVRQDDRPRFASDVRTITDPLTGAVIHADKKTVEDSRPFTRLARAGFDYARSEHDQFGVSGNYSYRSFERGATDHNLVSDGTGVLTQEYDRTRRNPEYVRTLEFSATYQHTFQDPGHQLNFELKTSSAHEQERNYYEDIFQIPLQNPTFDNTVIRNDERGREAIAEYVRPFDNGAKLEAGYDFTDDQLDADFFGEYLDPLTDRFVTDGGKTNRFTHRREIQAFYVTYARPFGRLGLLAGLRPELAQTTSRLVTTGAVIPLNYARIYPSLHLTYHLTDEHELQLNYSHRVHRPDIDDLNPFPEYTDPFTLRAGNPYLRPEDIHSIEAGYGYRRGETALTSTVYYRYLYNGFTNLTTDLGNGVLLTTHENLAVSRSTGIELTASTEFGKWGTLNFSSNTFFNTIDASNLGYSSSKSDISWLAKVGFTLRLPKDTVLQLNASYTSTRLTPQGERRPTYVANLGLRHDLWQKKAAVVLTVSDLFNSLKEDTILDTPALREEFIRRRSARIVYVGFIYNFGQPTKRSKDDPLKFDNAL